MVRKHLSNYSMFSLERKSVTRLDRLRDTSSLETRLTVDRYCKEKEPECPEGHDSAAEERAKRGDLKELE